MRFTTPAALLLLLLLPAFYVVGRSRGLRLLARDKVAIALRLAMVSLVVLALAGAQLDGAGNQLAVVFLVDVSDSVGQSARLASEEYVTAALESLRGGQLAGVILFGTDSLVERPVSHPDVASPFASVPLRSETDLAAAIRLGMVLFPEGSSRRLVILSDGQQTKGEALDAARAAAAANVQIDYVLLQPEADLPEALLARIDAPGRVSEGEGFTIDVEIQSNVEQAAELQVVERGVVISSREVLLRAGRNNVPVPVKAGKQSFARFEIDLLPVSDTLYQNNRLSTFTEIIGPATVLIVAEEPDPLSGEDGAAALISALELAGLRYERVQPLLLPSELTELSSYSSLILVDANAREFSNRQMESLQNYVRDLGGGLVTIGGPHSYAMGGYLGTPIEESLPISMRVEDQTRFPGVLIVLVMDRSGSMSAVENGVPKIQLAAEGAIRASELLFADDEMAVITIDTAPNVIIGPVTASDSEALARQISQITAGGGGIYIRTGLATAAEIVEKSDKPVRHIVVLADGADSEEQVGSEAIVSRLTSLGVTVSTVAIGQGKDVPWLESIADLGGGRFHLTDRAGNLPQIFVQEAAEVQRNYIIEEEFFPTQKQPSRILSGITAVPLLHGYVGASAKERATVVLSTHMDDPLLTTWQYGLGRVVSWTSDATGRWSREWVEWDGFPLFWSNVIRWTFPALQNAPIDTEIVVQDGEIVLKASTIPGEISPGRSLIMEAHILDPEGLPSDIELEQVAPGIYTGNIEPSANGVYLVNVTASDSDGRQIASVVTGWVRSYSQEFKSFSGDSALLEQIANVASGENLTGSFEESAIEPLFRPGLPASRKSQPLWPLLMIVAVVLLPLDIATRRLILTRRDRDRILSFLKMKFSLRRSEPEASSSQLARLQEVKKDAEARLSRTRPPERTVAAVAASEETVASEPDPVIDVAADDGSEPSSDESLAARLLKRRDERESDQ